MLTGRDIVLPANPVIPLPLEACVDIGRKKMDRGGGASRLYYGFAMGILAVWTVLVIMGLYRMFTCNGDTGIFGLNGVSLGVLCLIFLNGPGSLVAVVYYLLGSSCKADVNYITSLLP